MRGSSPACAACQGPQPLSRPPHSPSLPRRPPTRRPWPRSQTLAHPPRSSLLPRRPPARRPRPVRGPSQPLLRPACSPARLRQPSATRPAPAPGLPPLPAPCRGPRPGPRRGSPRSPPPAHQGGAGRRGWPLGRRGRPSRLAQVPGPAAAARPPPPPPASAPRAPRGSPPSTLGRRRGSGSGTGGGGGRPARGTHRSLPSLLPLVGMRGGRRALPTTSWCISAVPWAVSCGALRGGGGGGEGVGGRLWRQPRTAGGPRPSTGIGRGGGGATRPTRRATAPSLGRGSGPWAPGGRRAVGGSRTRWTPVTAVTSYVRRKVCTPSRAAGAGRGGRGTGVAP